MVPRSRWHVDEIIVPICSRLSRPDQGHLVFSALGDLLCDRLKDDFGAAANAVETRKSEKKAHLAMVDPNADRAE